MQYLPRDGDICEYDYILALLIVYVLLLIIWLHAFGINETDRIGSENLCLKFMFYFVSISTGVGA